MKKKLIFAISVCAFSLSCLSVSGQFSQILPIEPSPVLQDSDQMACHYETLNDTYAKVHCAGSGRMCLTARDCLK